MRYLGLALYAEGSSDYKFLCPLLQRLCEDVCSTESFQYVEISEVFSLNHPADENEAPREQRILMAAREARGTWTILFVHADGAGDPERARNQQAQPAIDLIKQELAHEGQAVAVIPIRETEAWAICDGDVLRQVFGTTLTDEQMDLPRLTSIESTPDPKQKLRQAFLKTSPSSRLKRQGVSPMLNAIGEQVSLSQLRRLSAFVSLESELKQALRHLRILP